MSKFVLLFFSFSLFCILSSCKQMIDLKKEFNQWNYLENPATYTINTTIKKNSPNISGGTFSISPQLPSGMEFDSETGSISGTPKELKEFVDYTVAMKLLDGPSTQINLKLKIVDFPPSFASNYEDTISTKGQALKILAPKNTGGAVISFKSLSKLPSGLDLNTVTGEITGTPTALSEAATYLIRAENSGGSRVLTLKLTVIDIAPLLGNYPETTAIKKQSLTISPGTNTGGAVTSYTAISQLPTGLSLNTSTGVISGIPSSISAATTYSIKAQNSGGSQVIILKLAVTEIAPKLANYEDKVAIKGITLSVFPGVSTGGEVTSYTAISSLPAGLSLNASTGEVSGKPTVLSDESIYSIKAENSAGSQVITLKLKIIDIAPVAGNYEDTIATKGKEIIIAAPQVNVGGQITSYASLSQLPKGLSLNTSSGIISGTPAEVLLPMTYLIKAQNTGGSQTLSLKLSVIDLPPVLGNYPDIEAVIGDTVNVPVPANTGGAVISYTANSPLPAGLTVNSATGLISGKPTESVAATYTILAKNSGGTVSITVKMTITNIIKRTIASKPHVPTPDIIPPVKVVLIVDNSKSMSSRQANLAAGIDKMLTSLTGYNLSFYLYTTTSVNVPVKSNLLASTTKPAAYVDTTYTYNGKTYTDPPAPGVTTGYSSTSNYLLADSLLESNGAPTFIAGADNSKTKEYLLNAIKNVGQTGDNNNEAGLCTLGRILADSAHKVVNDGKKDKVAFVILSDENDFSNSCYEKTEGTFQTEASLYYEGYYYVTYYLKSPCNSSSGDINVATYCVTSSASKKISFDQYQNVKNDNQACRSLANATFGITLGPNDTAACGYALDYLGRDLVTPALDLCQTVYKNYSNCVKQPQANAQLTTIGSRIATFLDPQKSSVQLQDAIISKATAMFGEDGFMVSALIHDTAIENASNNNCTRASSAKDGVLYKNLVEAIPNKRGKVGTICSNDYSVELKGIQDFVVHYNTYDFPAALIAGEVITSVWITRAGTKLPPLVLDTDYFEKKTGSLVSAISIPSSKLQLGDIVNISTELKK